MLCASVLGAQTATYNDVAVIINSNSPQSDSIGSYFAEQRDIHPSNIIRISAPVTEEITDAQFSALRAQVEAHLTAAGIADSINYLVTTKGVPLKVKRQDGWNSSSVESELSLLLGPYAGYIGGTGRIISPYYGSRTHFTRAAFGIYLVTRLDGYTVDDVKGIIDRSAVIRCSVPSGRFVLDMDPGWNSAAPYLNSRMQTAADTMQQRGIEYLLDATSLYLTGQQQVNGYVGWGSNDKHTSLYGRINFTWNPGAIAETYVSTSARSFTKPAVYGQSLIADLIEEEITAAKGYVYDPYASAMADVSILFDLYTMGFTVAESYYSSSPFLSWMDVVIGDPKFRLISSRLPQDAPPPGSGEDNSGLPVELTSFTALRTSSGIQLSWSTATETDNHGFELQRSVVSGQHSDPENRELTAENREWKEIGFVAGNGTSNISHQYTFTDRVNSGSMYSYRLRQIDRSGAFRYSAEVTVEGSGVPSTFALFQNYPNPFNPVTTIEYRIPVTGRTTLTIYDMLGREVRTLVNDLQPAGSYSVQFDASTLSSGIYFYTLRADSYRQTRKMVLIQ